MSRILTINSNIVTIAGNAASLSTNAPLQMKLVATLAACSVFSMQNSISYCFVPTTNITEFWALGTVGYDPTAKLKGPFYGTIFGVGGTAYGSSLGDQTVMIASPYESKIFNGSLHGTVLTSSISSVSCSKQFFTETVSYINVIAVNGGASVYQIITK